MIMLVLIMTMVNIMIVMIIRHHVSKAVTHLAAYCSVNDDDNYDNDYASYDNDFDDFDDYRSPRQQSSDSPGGLL